MRLSRTVICKFRLNKYLHISKLFLTRCSRSNNRCTELKIQIEFQAKKISQLEKVNLKYFCFKFISIFFQDVHDLKCENKKLSDENNILLKTITNRKWIFEFLTLFYSYKPYFMLKVLKLWLSTKFWIKFRFVYASPFHFWSCISKIFSIYKVVIINIDIDLSGFYPDICNISVGTGSALVNNLNV